MDFADRVAVCPLCGGDISSWADKQRGGHSYHYDRCQKCDFAFVNPRPTLASLSEYYSLRYAPNSQTRIPSTKASLSIPDPSSADTSTPSPSFSRPRSPPAAAC